MDTSLCMKDIPDSKDGVHRGFWMHQWICLAKHIQFDVQQSSPSPKRWIWASTREPSWLGKQLNLMPLTKIPEFLNFSDSCYRLSEKAELKPDSDSSNRIETRHTALTAVIGCWTVKPQTELKHNLDSTYWTETWRSKQCWQLLSAVKL